MEEISGALPDQSLWATLTTYASQRHALHASDQDLTALAAVVQQTQQTVERRRAGAAVGGGAGAPPPSAPAATPPPVAFETTNPDSLF